MIQNNVTRYLNARKILYEQFEIPGGKLVPRKLRNF